MKSLKDVLRYNGYGLHNFQNDPSSIFPGEAISARYDLNEGRFKSITGGIDCKITNSTFISEMTTIAINGPTTENNENLPVFKWGDHPFFKVDGLPREYNFDWVKINPNTLIKDDISDKYKF